MKMNDFEEMQLHLSKTLRNVFTAERLHLWLNDASTGIFYTINHEKKPLRCFMNRGLISDIIKNGKPISSNQNFNLSSLQTVSVFVGREFKESFLYEPTSLDTEKPVVENAIIFPIKNKANKVIGILEVNQNSREPKTSTCVVFI